MLQVTDTGMITHVQSYTSPPIQCSPNLALRDFFVSCFRMKKVLKGKRFADVVEVKQETTEALKVIDLNRRV